MTALNQSVVLLRERARVRESRLNEIPWADYLAERDAVNTEHCWAVCREEEGIG